MPLHYLDSSAVVKLIRDEPESIALRAHLVGSDLVSCELVLTEVPRAIHRAAGSEPDLDLVRLLRTAATVIDALALVPIDRPVLSAAGALSMPVLRALDAIHVVAAAGLGAIDSFVTYNTRQAAAAHAAGLPVVVPAR